MSLKTWELFYLILVCALSLVTFLLGFFPFSTQLESPNAGLGEPFTFLENINRPPAKSVNAKLYAPVVDKVVFIVIDSLRYDFIGDRTLLDQIYMPYVTSLLMRNDNACLVKAKASPPSVTMPRLKALMTGVPPTYIDIIRNFNTTKLEGDNILFKARKRGLKLVFYGDDTWLKMFPDYFMRSEGVTSFFVTDYTEVDRNVTRNVREELKKDDWNVMILHYLGLDHIGHIDSALSKLVEPKLKEMDKIVELIHRRLLDWNKLSGKSFLLILTGDHGMKDQGGHGGASVVETTVPFVTIGLPCSSQIEEGATQLDLAPTLSVLMGLPIPSSSIGRLMLPLLKKLSSDQLLFSLFYNNELLFKKYSQGGHKLLNDECYRDYLTSKDILSKWLSLSKVDASTIQNDSIRFYEKSSKCMSSHLIKNSTEFDLQLMMFGLALLVQVTVLLLFRPAFKKVSFMTIIYATLLFSFVLNFGGKYLLCGDDNGSATSLCTNGIFSFILVVFFVLNCMQMGFIEINVQKISISNKFLNFLIFGTILQMVSVISSSFIEEEHQIWYFLAPSFVTLMLLSVRHTKKNLVQLILILCMFRFFRKLNSTGDKWAAEIDIGDILRENKIWLSAFTFLSLFLNSLAQIWIRIRFLASKLPSLLHLFLLPLLATAHFMFQTILNGLYPFLNIHDFNDADINSISNVSVYAYWIIFLVVLVEDAFKLQVSRNQFTRIESWCEFLRTILMMWIFSVGLLQKAHNIVLIPIFVFVCHYIHKTLFDLYESNELILGIVHYWLGMLFYFYQGNSNSLATIDVSAGYVGQTHFDLVNVGFQICMNTSAYPILSYLLLLNYLIRSSDCTQRFLKKIRKINNIYLMIQVIHLTFYLFVITFHRYHLFIWSVFSPKLLYLSYQTVVLFTLIIVFELIYFVLETVF